MRNVTSRSLQWVAKKMRPIGDMAGLLTPRVGVPVIVFSGKSILLGERKGSNVGEGRLQVSGGHLEFFETVLDCARREVLEETNLKLLNPFIIQTTEHMYPKQRKHYIDIWVAGRAENPEEVMVKEPQKCSNWTFYPIDDIDRLSHRVFEGKGIIEAKFLRWLRFYMDVEQTSQIHPA